MVGRADLAAVAVGVGRVRGVAVQAAWTLGYLSIKQFRKIFFKEVFYTFGLQTA